MVLVGMGSEEFNPSILYFNYSIIARSTIVCNLVVVNPSLFQTSSPSSTHSPVSHPPCTPSVWILYNPTPGHIIILVPSTQAANPSRPCVQ